MSFYIFMSTDNVTIIIWSVNLWKPLDKHKHLIRNRMVKLCSSTRVYHKRYCMETLTKLYLQYGEVGYLIMRLLSGHESMAYKKKWSASFMFLLTDQSRMILGIMKMIIGKSWRPKTRTTKTPFTRNVEFPAE